MHDLLKGSINGLLDVFGLRGSARVTRLRRSIPEATANDARYWGDIEEETGELGGGLVSSSPHCLTSSTRTSPLPLRARQYSCAPQLKALNTVELANAATLSSSLGQEVTLPLVRSHYDNFINAKIAES